MGISKDIHVYMCLYVNMYMSYTCIYTYIYSTWDTPPPRNKPPEDFRFLAGPNLKTRRETCHVLLQNLLAWLQSDTP